MECVYAINYRVTIGVDVVHGDKKGDKMLNQGESDGSRLKNKYETAKVSLVLEGGGMRSFYTAGVLDAFLEHNMNFEYVITVSAGATNVVSYISQQLYRNLEILEKYVCNYRYMSKRNILRCGSMIGMDYIFDEIPNKLLPFDWVAFHTSKARYLTGAFDCNTGETIWYEKEAIDKESKVLRATCSLPFISKMVSLDGRKLLDGGLSHAIPIQKAIEDGNIFHVVVLTRNVGYQKPPSSSIPYKIAYKKFPKVAEVMEQRHILYNRQLELCEQLEREGKAIIIRPRKKLEVSRLEKNNQKIIELYHEGVKDAYDKLDEIKSNCF